MSDRKNSGRSFGGKGYYIALILCAAAIGISGYLYYHNANENDTAMDPDDPVLGTDAGDHDVAALASRPDTADATQSDTATTTAPNVKKVLKTSAPLEGQTVAAYAMEELSYNATTRDWRVHNGVDIAAESGTAVCAAADGVVYTVYEDDTMGMTVVIRHDGDYTTRYASLAETVSVEPGDEVTMGQTIGCVGNTALLETALGDHVHFSVACGDEAMDPAEFLEMGD